MYEIGMFVVLSNGICGVIEEIDRANETLYVYNEDGEEYVVCFDNPMAVMN